MDDTLLKYDESLEALEKQRENLELVMKKMGAEWEESGAGIGWMGDILYNNTQNDTQSNTILYTPPLPPPPLMSLMHSVTSSTSEPSHDYLQTLLNVNDKLLAQSLASSAYSRSSNFNSTRDYYPQLLKTSAFVSQQQLPISPSISQDDGDNPPPPPTRAVNVAQFTPPITPE